LIIKIDISIKIDDSLEIYLKDNEDNSYSNKVYVNLTKYSKPNITKIDL
jgi:hypothetical protein